MRENHFNVYIDEAGDEGFTIKNGKWVSSRWFILGALVVRQTNDLIVSNSLNEIKRKLNWRPNDPLHFTKLNHDQKKLAIDEIKKTGLFRCCYVAVDKKAFDQPTILKTAKGFLYNYCTRYLLERVTWLIKEKNGFAHLIFEHRSTTKYDQLSYYIEKLIADKQTQIKSGVIKSLETLNKNQSKNLQIADTIVGSLYNALEKNRYNMVESSYILELKPFIYNRDNNYHSYGLKFFPHPCNNMKVIQEFSWLKQFTESQIVV